MSSDDVLTQAAQRLALDLVDWWHVYTTNEPWPATGKPLTGDLLDAAEAFVEHAHAVLALPVSAPGRGYGESVCRRCDVQAPFCPCEKSDVVAPDRDALTDALREAFNTAYERSDNPRVDRMHRHDQHQYAGACHVCRGDVDVLVPHIADRLISAGLVRTPVTAEQIEKAAQEAR